MSNIKKSEGLFLKTILLSIAILPILYFYFVEEVPYKAFVLGTGSWGIGLIMKMISHQLIVVKLSKKKIGLIYESLVNGFLSGFFELSAAAVIIYLMIPQFEFDFHSILGFGLAIGSLETILVAWQGNEFLQGTTLEESANKLEDLTKNSEGIQYFINNYALPIVERVLSTFIHISTRGMVFLTFLSLSIFPIIIALIVFIIADGLLAYYFMVAGKIKTSIDLYKFYIYLFLLAAGSSLYFFMKISGYDKISL